MTRLVLRDYQRDAVNATFKFFEENLEGHPIVVMPTGSGKSLVIAEFIRKSIELWPKTRFLVVTHVRELVQQNYDEFMQQWDSVMHPAGIYSAGMKRRDKNAQVLFAGIQSIVNRSSEIGSFDIVLIDECHLVPKRGMGRYLTYLDALAAINPQVRVIGLTATHYRMDGGYLHKGKDRLFTDVAYEVTLDRLVPEFLAPLIAKQPKNVVDTSNVKVVAGEFDKSQLEEAAIDVTKESVHEAIEMGNAHGRRSWLAFAVTKKHANAIAYHMLCNGVLTKVVFGDTPKAERDKIIDDFKNGAFRCLVNVGVLTTGFNAKAVDMLIVIRPTKSTSLYVQIMGRGMRKNPDKTDCLVLDYGENVMRHGPINRVRPRTGPGDGEAPCKVCPECDTIVPLGTKVCDQCGFVWPKSEMDVVQTRKASTRKIIDFDPPPRREYEVNSIWCRYHEGKPGKAPSMRVDFYCGMLPFSEWVCFQHRGFPRRKAISWWMTYAGTNCPETVEEALERISEIVTPAKIIVVEDIKTGYDRVVGQVFPENPYA